MPMANLSMTTKLFSLKRQARPIVVVVVVFDFVDTDAPHPGQIKYPQPGWRISKAERGRKEKTSWLGALFSCTFVNPVNCRQGVILFTSQGAPTARACL